MNEKEAAAVLGRLGGKARAKALTSEERSAIASNAAKIRAQKLSTAELRRIAMMGVRARRRKARLAKQKGQK
jgi:hypothetical protein